jgi:hypothetical protein
MADLPFESGGTEPHPTKMKCKTNTIPILMHQMRISTNQVSSVVLTPKKLENVKAVKEPGKKNTVP